MTGIECLKEELLRRGCTKQQSESKVIPVVLDIFAETGDFYKTRFEQDRELEDLTKHILWLTAQKQNLDSMVDRLQVEVADLNDKKGTLADHLKQFYLEENEQLVDYINSFNSALKECETAEGRDRMRLAQVFVNSVEIRSKFDSTAFIHWLGAILAGDRSSGPIEGYKKSNPKLFETESRWEGAQTL